MVACALLVAPIVAGGAESADALYAGRAHLENARQAADLWRAALTHSPSFEAAWKLARADYWLGGHAPDQERRALYEQGIDAARRGVDLEPSRPEGHFWMAANMGALAESFGLRAGLRYRGAIKDELEFVRRTAPAFEQGSADRALGRWYFKVPALFGGSKKLGEEHLRTSLTYNPHSTASLYFLAELLLDDRRTAEARDALQQVIEAPFDPEWDPEDREFRQKARDLIGRTR
jgi:tetratricopeptide (TPR) repeat protein